MKETKVYVDELPESCFECKIMTDGSEGRDYCVCAILEEKAETKNRLKDCPLHSIKDHDRELVKEVCEKIREFCENNKYRCNKYFLLYSIGLNVKLLNKNKEGQKETFYEFLDQIQKEFEDGE